MSTSTFGRRALVDCRIDAGGHNGLRHAIVHQTGQNDDSNSRVILTHNADDLGNGQARHAEIRDDDLGRLPLRGKQRRITVGNRRHAVAGFRQDLGNE